MFTFKLPLPLSETGPENWAEIGPDRNAFGIINRIGNVIRIVVDRQRSARDVQRLAHVHLANVVRAGRKRHRNIRIRPFENDRVVLPGQSARCPAAPGNRAAGSGPVANGVNCPDIDRRLQPASCPLFQFVQVVRSRIAPIAARLFIQTAGMRWSLTHSMSPCETSTSVFDVPSLLPFNCIVLAYCQKSHGCVVP